MFSDRGVLVSGYGFDMPPDFGALNFQQKLAESRKSVERLHPGHAKELERPMYVNWGLVPYNEGAWISSYGPMQDEWTNDEPARQGGAARTNVAGYQTLLEPDGAIYFAGDHVSHIVGWQEGAALSALRAVREISERTKAARLSAQFPAGA
jgi:monoamine oxidase